jgi:Protein of unknown function (DUF3551)
MYLMRSKIMVLAALLLMAVLAPSTTGAYERPYDPYPWYANYAGRDFEATNCGFLTFEQCRATISGIGGSCEPNPFYNPRRSPPRHHRR